MVREVERIYDPAAAALGRTASSQAAQAKELQQLLGGHHDGVVVRTVLLDLAGKARMAGEDTFTYGLMHQRQACQAATIEPCHASRTRDVTEPRAPDRRRQSCRGAHKCQSPY